jgi:DHA2 family multidrug resistance protein
METDYWSIFLPQFLQGVGFGLIFVALSTAALSRIERPRMTAATGLYNVSRQIFSSIGISLAATKLDSGTTRYRGILVAHVSAYSHIAIAQIRELTGYMSQSGYDPVSARQAALQVVDGQVMQQASVLAFDHVFQLLTILFLLTLPLVFNLRGTPGAKPVEAAAD